MIPWVIYRFGEPEDFFKEYNSDASEEAVIQELISYSVWLMLLHELVHVFQRHIQYLSQELKSSQPLMNSKSEHLSVRSDRIMAVLEYAADVCVAEYMS